MDCTVCKLVCMAVWSPPASPTLSFCAVLCVHGGHPVADWLNQVFSGLFFRFCINDLFGSAVSS